jgi:hypothetical protein
MRFSASPFRPRALSIALALALGACATWTRQPVQQDPFVGGPVRVTRTDGSRVLLDSVTITADSIVGRGHGGARARVALAAADVRRVEARRADPMATVALVVGMLAGAVSLWASYRAGVIRVTD